MNVPAGLGQLPQEAIHIIQSASNEGDAADELAALYELESDSGKKDQILGAYNHFRRIADIQAGKRQYDS